MKVWHAPNRLKEYWVENEHQLHLHKIDSKGPHKAHYGTILHNIIKTLGTCKQRKLLTLTSQ